MEPAATAPPKPHANKKPAAVRKSRVHPGSQMGLVKRTNGIKKMNPRTVAERARAVRIRRVKAETKKMNKKARRGVVLGA